MTTVFKKGDRVEFTENYNAGKVKAGDQYTVSRTEDDQDGDEQLVFVTTETWGVFAKRLKLAEFKVGDRVEFTEEYSKGPRAAGRSAHWSR
jgi:putative ubiquitin-RnfH superfamily antitoxin RatB of RatAB toxin-antitoxin module